MTEPSLATALERIDAANAVDPNRITVDGEDVAKELAYGRRMSAWLDRLFPDATDELRIAVRAQHLCRWELARADYPAGRAGYKKWRSDAARMHADRAGALLEQVGYGADTIDRVRSLLMKRRLGTDADAQRLEDVACLVFLDHYFDDFAAPREDEPVVTIVRKTWGKMSEHAHAAALSLTLSPRAERIVAAALAGEGK